MGGSKRTNVVNTALHAAAKKLINLHGAEAFQESRDQLFSVGLPTDFYERVAAARDAFGEALSTREALADAVRGEAAGTRLDAVAMARWVRVVHAAARAVEDPVQRATYKALLGVGDAPTGNARVAQDAVAKLLTAIGRLPAGHALVLPAGHVEAGRALLGKLTADVHTREDTAAARGARTMRLKHLEATLEGLFDQVLARAALVEEITGQPVLCMEFGYVRSGGR